MAHGRNKYQSRENRARVREILMRDWDPIGVAGFGEAADEYDTYADKAYVMLMDEHASADAIARSETIALRGDPDEIADASRERR